MTEEGVAEALVRYLSVHGRRILSNLGDQEEVRIEIRALFRYYEKKDKEDKITDHLKGFEWRGCRVEGDYIIVPISLIEEFASRVK